MLDFGGGEVRMDGEDQVKGKQALVSLGLFGPSEAYKSLAYERLLCSVDAEMTGEHWVSP